MSWYKTTESGIILPPDKPKEPPPRQAVELKLFLMEYLCANQICPFIEMVHNAGGHIECVSRQSGMGIVGRYSIVYSCEEELGMEVPC